MLIWSEKSLGVNLWLYSVMNLIQGYFSAWQINQINRINHTKQIDRGSMDPRKLGGRSINKKTKGPIDLRLILIGVIDQIDLPSPAIYTPD